MRKMLAHNQFHFNGFTFSLKNFFHIHSIHVQVFCFILLFLCALHYIIINNITGCTFFRVCVHEWIDAMCTITSMWIQKSSGSLLFHLEWEFFVENIGFRTFCLLVCPSMPWAMLICVISKRVGFSVWAEFFCMNLYGSALVLCHVIWLKTIKKSRWWLLLLVWRLVLPIELKNFLQIPQNAL